MGKIAQPNTPYCGGFTQGAISVGGRIFTTQNPPISYTLSGKTATISDATGVIGTADLTGKFAEQSNGPASPEVDYCAGKPFARLEWKAGLSDWAINSENPPIRYSLTPATPGTPDQWDYIFVGTGSLDGCKTFYSVIFRQPVDTNPIVEEAAPPTAPTSTCDPSGTVYKAQAKVSFPGGGQNLYIYSAGQTVPTNTFYPAGSILNWHFSLPNLYSKTFVPGTSGNNWILTVTDATGQIFSREFEVEPTNFVVRCYDYDITEVKYVCEGACPSAEFECRCEVSNTLMCYGWDPENENVFKPLFTTSITSG